MSGGVDSSLAAALLKEAGRDVMGITLRLWGEERDSEPAITSAKEVCKTIGIEHKILEKKGAWIAFNGELVGQGREAAKLAIKENPDLAAKVKAAILEKVSVKGGTSVTGPSEG